MQSLHEEREDLERKVKVLQGQLDREKTKSSAHRAQIDSSSTYVMELTAKVTELADELERKDQLLAQYVEECKKLRKRIDSEMPPNSASYGSIASTEPSPRNVQSNVKGENFSFKSPQSSTSNSSNSKEQARRAYQMERIRAELGSLEFSSRAEEAAARIGSMIRSSVDMDHHSRKSSDNVSHPS